MNILKQIDRDTLKWLKNFGTVLKLLGKGVHNIILMDKLRSACPIYKIFDAMCEFLRPAASR